MSPSTRGCGLKFFWYFYSQLQVFVTLHARVWIEIVSSARPAPYRCVTLHARVWIEIPKILTCIKPASVTLHARVWIEMALPEKALEKPGGHPPREGVD